MEIYLIVILAVYQIKCLLWLDILQNFLCTIHHSLNTVLKNKIARSRKQQRKIIRQKLVV